MNRIGGDARTDQLQKRYLILYIVLDVVLVMGALNGGQHDIPGMM